MPTPTPKWFTSPRPDPEARLRLFCLPYAGGGASVFRTWWSDLPPGIELCALQLPGREARFREPLVTSLPALIGQLADAIAPWLDRPFAVFGHSMGGLIGFELTRALARRGGPQPRALLVSGRGAPGSQLPREPMLHTLSDEDLQQELIDMNGMEPAVLADPDLMSLVLQILRADFALCETHRHVAGPRLGCPIVAFGGVHDRTVPPGQLDGWAAETTAGFRLNLFPGAHFFFKHAWKDFARALSAELAPLVDAVPANALRIGA